MDEGEQIGLMNRYYQDTLFEIKLEGRQNKALKNMTSVSKSLDQLKEVPISPAEVHVTVLWILQEPWM